MMNTASLEYKSGKIETHFVIGNDDLSICGHDIIGDDEYCLLEDGKDRVVNCDDCLEIFKACRNH